MYIICRIYKKSSVRLSKELKKHGWKLTSSAIRKVLLEMDKSIEKEPENDGSDLESQSHNADLSGN